MSGTTVKIIAGSKVVLDKLKEIQNIRIDQAKELKPIVSGALPTIPASPADQDYKMYVSGGKTGATFTGPGLPGGSVTLSKTERGTLWFDKDTRAWSLLDVQELPIAEGTTSLQDAEIPKGIAVKHYAPSKLSIGIINYIIGENIFKELTDSSIDDPLIWKDGFYNKTTGVLNPTAGSFKASVKKYYIPPNCSFDYSFVLYGGAGVVFYNENDEVVGQIGTTNTSATVLTGVYNSPVTKTYARVSHNLGSSKTNLFFKIKENIELVTSEVFVQTSEFDNLITLKTDIVKTETIQEVNSSLNDFGLKIIPEGFNLFPFLIDSNLEHNLYWINGFIRNTGVVTPDVNWRHTPPLNIPPGIYQSNLYVAGNAVMLILDLNLNITQVLSNKGASPGNAVWSFTVNPTDSYIVLSKTKTANFDAFVRTTEEMKFNDIVVEAKVNSHEISKNLSEKIAKLQCPIKTPRPIITFISDDGAVQNDWFIDALNVYGWKATFAIITGRFSMSGFMTKAQVKDLINNGHEIAGHTVTHNTSAQLATLTESQLHDEIGKCKFDLLSLDNRMDVVNFVSPFGSRNLTVDKVVRQYFDANYVTRADADIESGEAINQPPIDNYFMKRVSFDVNSPTSGALHISRIDIAKQAVDKVMVDGGWLIFAIHPHYAQYLDPANTVDSKQEFRDLLAYINSQNITVMTASQARKHYKNYSIGNHRLDSEYYERGINGVEVGSLL